MKKILLQKGQEQGIKCIDVFDASIKPNEKRLATVFCDGEIVFYSAMYSYEVKQVTTIADNFGLFYDNI